MRFEFHLLLLLVGIGLFTRRLAWRGWALVALLLFAWIMYNWKYA